MATAQRGIGCIERGFSCVLLLLNRRRKLCTRIRQIQMPRIDGRDAIDQVLRAGHIVVGKQWIDAREQVREQCLPAREHNRVAGRCIERLLVQRERAACAAVAISGAFGRTGLRQQCGDAILATIVFSQCILDCLQIARLHAECAREFQRLARCLRMIFARRHLCLRKCCRTDMHQSFARCGMIGITGEYCFVQFARAVSIRSSQPAST